MGEVGDVSLVGNEKDVPGNGVPLFMVSLEITDASTDRSEQVKNH